MASKLTRVELHSLKITIPYSVIQVWSDLEVGQVVKLPSKDDQDELVTLLAHRDGPEMIEFEFTKSLASALHDAYAARVNIAKVEQTYLDALSNAVAKDTAKQAVGNGIVPVAMARDTAPVKPLIPPAGTPPILQGLGLISMAAVAKMSNSENGMDSQKESADSQKESAHSPAIPVVGKKRHVEVPTEASTPNKQSRGPKQYECNLCEQSFVYLTSFRKHIYKHAKEAKSQDQTLDMMNMISMLNRIPQSHATAEKAPSRPQPINIQPKPQRVSSPLVEIKMEPDSQTDVVKVEPVTIQPATGALSSPTCSQQVALSPSAPVRQQNSSVVALMADFTLRQLQTECVPQHPVPHLTSPHIQEASAEKQENMVTMSMDDDPNCWICSRNFTYRTSFIKHMRTEHQITVVMEDQNRPTPKKPERMAFRCQICNQMFYGAGFAKHMLQSHGITVPPETLEALDATHKIATTAMPHGICPSSPPQDGTSTVCQPPTVLSLRVKDNGEYSMLDAANELILGDGLICSVCLKTFQYKQSFLSHMRQSHGVDIRDDTERMPEATKARPRCTACDETFEDKARLLAHTKTAHEVATETGSDNETLFPCSVCATLYRSETELCCHLEADHRLDIQRGTKLPKMFVCSECPVQFKFPSALEFHLMEKHGIVMDKPASSGFSLYADDDSQDGSLQMEVLGPNDLSDDEREAEGTASQNSGTIQGTCIDIPERVLSPGGKSMIKCSLCERTFKFTIAYQKHIKSVHGTGQNNNGNHSPVLESDEKESPDGSNGVPDTTAMWNDTSGLNEEEENTKDESHENIMIDEQTGNSTDS